MVTVSYLKKVIKLEKSNRCHNVELHLWRTSYPSIATLKRASATSKLTAAMLCHLWKSWLQYSPLKKHFHVVVKLPTVDECCIIIYLPSSFRVIFRWFKQHYTTTLILSLFEVLRIIQLA